MRLGMIIDYSGGFAETVELLQEYERNGLELVAVAEAYSFDSVSQLGYIAAKTEKLQLMSGIFQIYTRTPSLTAMTAAGLDFVSDGRFNLGLGASGPQVIEGFHGVKYDAPLGRTREVIEICRQVWRREPVEFRGKHYTVPLTKEDGGSGLGKPLKITAILLLALLVRFMLHRLVDRVVRQAEVGVLPDRVGRMSLGHARSVESTQRDTAGTTRRVQRAQTMGSLLKSIITGVITAIVVTMILAEVGVNVANVLDADPPVVATWSDFHGASAFVPSLHDALGRRYTLGVELEF